MIPEREKGDPLAYLISGSRVRYTVSMVCLIWSPIALVAVSSLDCLGTPVALVAGVDFIVFVNHFWWTRFQYFCPWSLGWLRVRAPPFEGPCCNRNQTKQNKQTFKVWQPQRAARSKPLNTPSDGAKNTMDSRPPSKWIPTRYPSTRARQPVHHQNKHQ